MLCLRIRNKAITLSRVTATPTRLLVQHSTPTLSIRGARYKHAYMQKADASISKGALREELKWVGGDRVTLMNRIEKMLTDDEFEKAVALVMAAEREGTESIASWNALLGEETRKNGPEVAFKLFNDIKKRGVKPNEYTYTVLFRALAKHPSKRAVQIGMSLYNTLKPDSPVPRSIVHTNAVLQLCSNHNNMAALWEIVGGLPSTGPGAPDNVTYSTILRAILKSTETAIDKLDQGRDKKLISEKKISAVREGKMIWADIVNKWRKGDVIVDQRLVFHMANLLCFGQRRRDLFDLLALLEQTMNIKRPEAMMKLVQSMKERLAATNHEREHRQKAVCPSDIHEDPEDIEPAEEISSEDLFKPVILDGVPTRSISQSGGHDLPKPSYSLPTNRELTILLRACRNFSGGPAIGRQYWTMLTTPDGPFNIEPDRTSYHEYLRILRVTRSSAITLHLIQSEMVPKGVAFTNTFVIALSTCFRDKNNPNVLETASTLIDIMPTTWAGSHPKVISSYIDLVRLSVSPPRLYADTRGNSVFPERDQDQLYKNRLLSAIRHLAPHIQKLQQFLNCQNRRDETDQKMYGDEEVTEYGTSSPAALADQSHITLKRIAGMIKDLHSPSIAHLLSADEADQLKLQALRLHRILNPGPPRSSWDRSSSGPDTAEAAGKLRKRESQSLSSEYTW
ncbi:hypothetical protein PRK78_005250 [Emydomyces testavorans]|uniref:Pentatricopeptide repeat protein n=1 Tax=Emydomyces testavorans TaxID=2070801 RepID=A0AAF0IJC0_9EURO|nr:hypothetical protein PRK78_005250 [Emydomyces testavorans]